MDNNFITKTYFHLNYKHYFETFLTKTLKIVTNCHDVNTMFLNKSQFVCFSGIFLKSYFDS